MAALVLSLMTVFISLFVTISFSLISAIQAIDAQPESISVQNTIVIAPLTIVVPITADVQNAQICVSIASSGDQSCTQVVVDPEENSYDPVNVDLSSEIPTLTAAEQEPTDTTTAAATTTEPTSTTTTTTTEEQPTVPTTTTEPTPAPTEEPTTDTGTQGGGTTTEEPAPDSGTQEPSIEGSTSEGGSQ